MSQFRNYGSHAAIFKWWKIVSTIQYPRRGLKSKKMFVIILCHLYFISKLSIIITLNSYLRSPEEVPMNLTLFLLLDQKKRKRKKNYRKNEAPGVNDFKRWIIILSDLMGPLSWNSYIPWCGWQKNSHDWSPGGKLPERNVYRGAGKGNIRKFLIGRKGGKKVTAPTEIGHGISASNQITIILIKKIFFFLCFNRIKILN